MLRWGGQGNDLLREGWGQNGRGASSSSSTVRTLPEDKCSRNAGFFMHVNRPTSKCSGKF
jgi:hypothetical protein